MAIFATAPDELSRWLPRTAALSRMFAARRGERQLLVLEVDCSGNDPLVVPIPARDMVELLPRGNSPFSLLEHQFPHSFGTFGGPNAPPVPPELAMPDWLSRGAPMGPTEAKVAPHLDALLSLEPACRDSARLLHSRYPGWAFVVCREVPRSGFGLTLACSFTSILEGLFFPTLTASGGGAPAVTSEQAWLFAQGARLAQRSGPVQGVDVPHEGFDPMEPPDPQFGDWHPSIVPQPSEYVAAGSPVDRWVLRGQRNNVDMLAPLG